MKEVLCKDLFGEDISWDPSEFDGEGLCERCKFTKGKCPNKYIGKDDGSALYCMWYQSKKEYIHAIKRCL